MDRREISLVRHSFNQTKKISVISWLLKKTFKPDISARNASTYLDLRYPTTHNAFEQVWRSIVHHLANDDALLKGEIEDDELYFGERRKGKRGRRNRNKTMVSGI